MIIEFTAPLEEFGGCSVLNLTNASREEAIEFCATLARAVNRLEKERAVGPAADADVREFARQQSRRFNQTRRTQEGRSTPSSSPWRRSMRASTHCR
jgi:hypothetical protein